MAFQIREIGDDDLVEVVNLLSEGFPSRGQTYWQQCIAALGRMALVPPYPRYGYVLVADGALQGVMLLLTARLETGPRSNLSSWYVRPIYRKFASFLFQRSLKTKGGVYLNVSPADHVLAIVKAFGFTPYTGGTYLLDPRAIFHRAGGRVSPCDDAVVARLTDDVAMVIERHQEYGCQVCAIEDDEGLMPALFRVKRVRGLVPVASFLWGDPARLVRNRGALMRWLVTRGIPAALIDAPMNSHESGVALFPRKGVRYRKGTGDVAPGDLRDTEMAIFGP